MTVYLATENPGKIEEVRALFAAKLPTVTLMTVADMPAAERQLYRAEENGETYAENALIKAQALAKIVSGFVLAEDSGFEVERLGRSPGVHSARYAPDDASRCEKILRALQGVPENKRTAQFVACVVLLEDGRNPIYFFGRCQGRVAESRRGSGGFGYDPIFIPDGENQTWGELPPEKKRQHSHRSQAFARAIDYLVVRLSQLSIATGIRTGSHSSDG